MSAAPKKYHATAHGVMEWAKHELEHVGRIASVEDKDIQYSYALSTLNGMAHLRDALFELVNDPAYESRKEDLLRTHDAVIRVMKHLIKEYNLDLQSIANFNTHKVLSNMSYIADAFRENQPISEEYNNTQSNTASEPGSVGGVRRRKNSRKSRKNRKHK